MDSSQDSDSDEKSKPSASKPDISKSSANKSDISKSSASKPNISKSSASKPNISKSSASKPDISKSSASKPDISKSSASKPVISKSSIKKGSSAPKTSKSDSGEKPKSSASKSDTSKCSTKKTSLTLKIPANVRALNKQRLQELVQDLNPNQTVDDEVEEMLLEITDAFLDNVLNLSCSVAQNRHTKQLDVKDVQIILENYWNMNIPVFESEELDSLGDLNQDSQNKKKKTSGEADGKK